MVVTAGSTSTDAVVAFPALASHWYMVPPEAVRVTNSSSPEQISVEAAITIGSGAAVTVTAISSVQPFTSVTVTENVWMV